MASNIDPTQPPASNPTTAAMRANMAAAKAEIESLQLALSNELSTIIKMGANSAALASGSVIPYETVQRDDLGAADIVNGRIYIPVGAKLVRFTSWGGTSYNAEAGTWQRWSPIFMRSGTQLIPNTLGLRSFTGALLNLSGSGANKANEFSGISNWIDVSALSNITDFYVHATLNHENLSPLVVVAQSSFQLEAKF